MMEHGHTDMAADDPPCPMADRASRTCPPKSAPGGVLSGGFPPSRRDSLRKPRGGRFAHGPGPPWPFRAIPQ
jgi:hypothetical protein